MNNFKTVLSVLVGILIITNVFTLVKLNDVSTTVGLNKVEAENSLGNLKNETNQNFKVLQDFFNKQNEELRLNLESQVSDVSKQVADTKLETQKELTGIQNKVSGIEDKSSELEDMISDIQVQSSDFSAIVPDVVKAVVSVKTNIGQGSGVIFNSAGYIMTNKHVLEGANAVSAVTYDGTYHSVQILGFASNADLAVIKIADGGTYDFLNWATSANVGQRVIAVGNPLGLSFSVTEGIVSALDRDIDETSVGYIQTDVSINPGNSGGPLVDSSKRIVGINTLKIGDSEGLGFAIPYDIAKSIGDQALAQG